LAVTLTELFHFGMNLIVVVVFFVATGVEPRWTWLQLPLLVGVLIVLALGCSMLISALYVRFRDMDPIWEVVLQLGFWGSPVIYAIGAVPGGWQGPLSCNPVASVLNQMRYALIDPNAPDAARCIGGAWKLSIPAAITIGVFLLGWFVFKREAPKIAENL
jgi:ABC-2 type transport system permease protein